ncbi:MAG: hypothetical protein ACLTE2_01740 [Eubacteriales bacterium]
MGGCIKIDGVDIRDVPRSELRSPNLGMVLPEILGCFTEPHMINIKYGKYDANRNKK